MTVINVFKKHLLGTLSEETNQLSQLKSILTELDTSLLIDRSSMHPADHRAVKCIIQVVTGFCLGHVH